MRHYILAFVFLFGFIGYLRNIYMLLKTKKDRNIDSLYAKLKKSRRILQLNLPGLIIIYSITAAPEFLRWSGR